jgi:hypothetical protein
MLLAGLVLVLAVLVPLCMAVLDRLDPAHVESGHTPDHEESTCHTAPSPAGSPGGSSS